MSYDRAMEDRWIENRYRGSRYSEEEYWGSGGYDGTLLFPPDDPADFDVISYHEESAYYWQARHLEGYDAFDFEDQACYEDGSLFYFFNSMPAPEFEGDGIIW